MLRNIKQLYGNTLGASDGDIGKVKDFYFDDQQWAVRYVIAETGTWLLGRLVLISPPAFGNFHEEGNRLIVNLTRQQIEKSPPIESHKPVSRQYEEEYNRYYGWPSYWARGSHLEHGGYPHLRSTLALSGYPNFTGYKIQTSDGVIGHVNDFLMYGKSWAICHLVVETGHWFSHREIAISPKDIERISYEESKVFVKVTKEALLEAPEYHVPPLGAT